MYLSSLSGLTSIVTAVKLMGRPNRSTDSTNVRTIFSVACQQSCVQTMDAAIVTLMCTQALNTSEYAVAHHLIRFLHRYSYSCSNCDFAAAAFDTYRGGTSARRSPAAIGAVPPARRNGIHDIRNDEPWRHR